MPAPSGLPSCGTRGNRAKARGRAAVLGCLVAFVLLQVAYHPLSDRWPQLLDGEYGHKHANLRAQVEARAPGQPCVVMFGSSLTGWGLNPASMSTLRPGTPDGPVVYNFGINSSGPVVQLLCLRRLLAAGVRPDLVLVEIHPWFLFYSYNHVAGKHYLPETRFQFRDLTVVRRYDPLWSELRRKWAAIQWLPWYYQRHNLQNNFFRKWVPQHQRGGVWELTDRHGWEGNLSERHGGGAYTPEVQLQSARHNLRAMHLSPIDETFPRAYREVLATCQREKIAVVMVNMPQTNCFRREIEPELKARVEARFGALSRDSGVPIIDAREWVPDDGFRDAFHLIPPGSEIFSRRLEREYLVPFLKGRGALAQRSPATP